MSDGLYRKDISNEYWREYEFTAALNNVGEPVRITYRIESPVLLAFREGGATHRVVDSKNVVHCVPAPGMNGCVLRWYNGEGNEPINF